jgi:hypothetical protein
MTRQKPTCSGLWRSFLAPTCRSARRGLYACALVAALVLIALAPDVSAQMFVTTGKDTLRSLPGVELIVEPMQPELEAAGLTAAAVKADAQQQLRAARVPLFASQGENTSPAKPYLYIHLNAIEIPGRDLLAVAIQVHVRQTVRSLATASNIVDAMTWDSHAVVHVPAKGLRSVRAAIAEHVDRFVKDWTAVH